MFSQDDVYIFLVVGCCMMLFLIEPIVTIISVVVVFLGDLLFGPFCPMGGKHNWEVLDKTNEDDERRRMSLPRKQTLFGTPTVYNRVCLKCHTVENHVQLLLLQLKSEREERAKAHDIFIRATKANDAQADN